MRPIALILLMALAGCTARPAERPEAAGTVGYWFAQPGEVRVAGDDYRALWEAADEARQRFGFDAAMRDYRGGELTTEPLTSAQWFEPWRTELRSAGDVLASSLVTQRRRLRFVFTEPGDGTFVVEPQAIVEQYTQRERRVTSGIYFRGLFGPGRQRGSAEADAGLPSPNAYWYATGRDAELERSLANRIRSRVEGAQVIRAD